MIATTVDQVGPQRNARLAFGTRPPLNDHLVSVSHKLAASGYSLSAMNANVLFLNGSNEPLSELDSTGRLSLSLCAKTQHHHD
jgi:hypothetical protein